MAKFVVVEYSAAMADMTGLLSNEEGDTLFFPSADKAQEAADNDCAFDFVVVELPNM